MQMNTKRIRSLTLGLFIMLLVTACTRAQPKLHLGTAAFNLGRVENGDIVPHMVLIYNQGNAPLVIQEVSTSCSCTTGSIEPSSIQPGERGKLKIEFDSGAHGPELEGKVTRQIFITSNDPQQQEALVEFTAEIIRPASTE